jgi:AcrR family transcriptional regulator
MSNRRPRPYRSPARERQADETRARILAAARELMREHGFDGTTIDAVARVAGVSPQTVYGAFDSKRGIVAELLERARFGPGYQALVAEARQVADPRVRLEYAARISRQIYDSERETLELLRGAASVSPELAALEREHEDERRGVQAAHVKGLAEAGVLRPDLDVREARDILWALTSRDMYRLLVVARGWSSDRYERWLRGAIARELVGSPVTTTPRARPPRGPR